MKVVLTASQKQTDGKIEMSFNAEIDKRNKSKIVGSLLNELFDFIDLQKKHRLTGFKSNEITDVKISLGDIELNTEMLTKFKGDRADVMKAMRMKMKLRNNPVGKKAFALLVWDIADLMTRELSNKSFELLIEELTDKAEELKAAKLAELN
jgi:hypothetical protein